MQKKVWYYEKWVGLHASFPARRSVKKEFAMLFIRKPNNSMPRKKKMFK